MPDISMCENSTCPKRTECHRWRAIPSEFRQSYGMFKWTERPDGSKGCDYFSPLWPGDNVRELDADGKLTSNVVRLPLAKPEVGRVWL